MMIVVFFQFCAYYCPGNQGQSLILSSVDQPRLAPLGADETGMTARDAKRTATITEPRGIVL
jgi:hypothetical protein